MVIRQLTSDDVGLMREMLSAFGKVFEQEDTYGRTQPSDAYLEGLLGSGSFIAFAAMESGSVVGGVAAYELKKFEQKRSEIYIYDLAVVSEHRRRGIATDLIEALKGIARTRGAYVIFVQADLTDSAAIALYSKLGQREDVLHFDIKVR